MTNIPASGLQMRTEVDEGGTLKLSLVDTPVIAPKAGEVLVRVEAAPINPSDLGLLLGPADVTTMKAAGTADSPELHFTVPEDRLRAVAARIGESLPIGNEGAGTVIAAGEGAEALMGKRVGMMGGAMYAQYRTVRVMDCIPLPDDASAADGASCFVNPLTALSMVEAMRMEGHTALVHTAAASNLGQMLNRICIADGVPLVNVVRSDEQVALLKAAGAVHVCNMSAPGFFEDLVSALRATGATIAFDAVGGGKLANQILAAMEIVCAEKEGAYSRYGSETYKQVYMYGVLELAPTTLTRSYGMAWGLSGWLLTPFLKKLGMEGAIRLRNRVATELKTTFASHYTRTISMKQALEPAVVADYAARATGKKYLIDPSL